jgi:hypothetical protein
MPWLQFREKVSSASSKLNIKTSSFEETQREYTFLKLKLISQKRLKCKNPLKYLPVKKHSFCSSSVFLFGVDSA